VPFAIYKKQSKILKTKNWNKKREDIKMKINVVEFEEMMRKGYEEMAEINQQIANQSTYIESEADEIIQSNLKEY
jgi:hypothetical protein